MIDITLGDIIRGTVGQLAMRLVHRVSSTRTFTCVAPHVVPALDRAVHRITRGRLLLSSIVRPGLILTTTGARSGLPRHTPLACLEWRIPTDDAEAPTPNGWIVIGSNFGRTPHPAWTANLLAHPDAEVNWKGEDIPVTAQLLKGQERQRVWGAVRGFWPPIMTYRARAGREIRLFLLIRRYRRRRIYLLPGDGPNAGMVAYEYEGPYDSEPFSP